MAARWTELVVDCVDPERVAEFWSAVLGWPVKSYQDGGAAIYEVGGGPGSGPSLVFVPVPERKSCKNRLHIDVNPVDADQGAEVKRLIALGATRADVGQGEPDWVVLADIEGNEFCVLRTRHER